jgi:serine protease AprX
LADLNGDRISDGLGAAIGTAGPNDTFDVVVTWVGPVDVPRAEQAAGRISINRHFSAIDGFSATMTVAQIRALSRVPNVFRIEENFEVTATMDEATAEYGTDLAISAFGVDGSGVDVCVLDTGADFEHEQLDTRFGGWFDAINGQPTPYDDHGHGTHVASMLLGDGAGSSKAAQYRGVAPGATLWAGKVLSAAGSGSEAQIIAGIDWCIANGVDVISMSLGTSTGSDGQDALSQAVNGAVGAGIVSVIAAGNSGDGPESVGSPGAAADAITVGASSKISAGPYLAPFSSRGPTLDGRLKPDIAAPGVAITAADANTGTGYATYSGTSMATPFAAGTVALALQRNNGLTPAQVKANLAATAVDLGSVGPDNNWGAGLLDGYSFIDLADGSTAGRSLNLPSYQALSATVSNNGLWTTSFTLTPDDLSSPIAATILIDGQLECSLFLFGICFISEWSPDLDARLIDPNGQTLWLSECPLSGDCGSTGQQETIHVVPTVAGDYRLEVFPFSGSPNDGQGGPFTVDLFFGPIGGTTPPPNTAPTAVDDAVSTNEDTELSGDVLAANPTTPDSDPEGDPLFVSLGTDVANGDLTLSSDGTFTYLPDENFFGEDTFTYTLSDGDLTDGSATVTITVNAVNDPPVPSLDAASTDEDVPVNIAVLTGATDVEGDPISLLSITQPAHGTTVINGDGVTVYYTPTSNFYGTDSFDYTISDGNGGTASATVTITVNPINDAPTAQDDSAATEAPNSVIINVLANDTDVDGDSLSVSILINPANGTATANLDGTVTYRPNAESSGTDTFTYLITDGHEGTASATVSVVVTAAPTSNLHVGDLDGSAGPVRKGKWLATGTVIVHDQDDNTVAGATVMYSWGDGSTGTCTTSESGECSATNLIKKRFDWVDFTIDYLAKTDYSYDPVSNHDPDGDSNGTTIMVSQ